MPPVTKSLNRYTTLITTNSDLKRQQNEHADAMERVRNETQLFQKQKTDDILNMNNRIARLKKHLESIRLASADEEAVKDSSLQVTSQNTLEYGQVRYICWTSAILHPSVARYPAGLGQPRIAPG